MVTCAVSVLISWVSFFINSVPGANFLDFIFVITSERGINGQLGLLKKSRPFNQLLSSRAVAHNPRVPTSAGLSSVGTWFNLSSLISSKNAATQFATKTGCFSSECIQCSTNVLSVHMKHLLIFSENERCTSCRNQGARKAACNSKFGIIRHFMRATPALPKTKVNLVASVALVTNLPQRKTTALKMCCMLSPNNLFSSFSTIFSK